LKSTVIPGLGVVEVSCSGSGTAKVKIQSIDPFKYTYSPGAFFSAGVSLTTLELPLLLLGLQNPSIWIYRDGGGVWKLDAIAKDLVFSTRGILLSECLAGASVTTG
jgi:hypothetical protein